MDEVKKSIMVTILWVASTAGVLAWTLATGRAPVTPAVGQLQPVMSSETVRPATDRPVVGESAPNAAAGPAAAPKEALSRQALSRVTFARSLQRRYQDRGMEIEAHAEEPERTTLAINWLGEPDDAQISGIQQAEPLHREIRDIGFTLLILRKQGQEIWRFSL